MISMPDACASSTTVGGPPILSARGVTVTFGGLKALDRVDIDIPPASIVGLVGPNGAGKSTLFGVLSGFLRSDDGVVEYLGDDVSHVSPQKRARRGLARSFQHPELFRSLTVAEHLVLAHRVHRQPNRIWTDFLTCRGWMKPNAAEVNRVTELIELVGLHDVAHAVAEGLSTGVTRLLEVARGLAADPKLLLLDEPAAGLDEHERGELSVALRSVREAEGVALLIVEHDMEFILGLSEEVYVLDFGKMIARGHPDEIRRDPAVQAAYLGDVVYQNGEE
jgi:ABC-type branched-subunit amino acid transport system ATPase component